MFNKEQMYIQFEIKLVVCKSLKPKYYLFDIEMKSIKTVQTTLLKKKKLLVIKWTFLAAYNNSIKNFRVNEIFNEIGRR